MGLIDGRELGATHSDQQIRDAVTRRRAWLASSGFDSPGNPYWDDELGVYLLELYQDDKSILADAYLATLPAEQEVKPNG